MQNNSFLRENITKNISEINIIEIAKKAMKQYKKREFDSLILIKSGASSFNYLGCIDKKKYVIRIEVFRKKADLNEDRRLANIANLNGVNTPYENCFIESVLGSPVSIRPYVIGRILSEIKESKGLYYLLAGDALAKINNCKDKSKRKYFYNWAYSEKSINNISNEIINSNCFDKKIYSMIKYAVDDLKIKYKRFKKIKNDLPIGLVHVDFKANNLVIVRKNEINVLDWEKATISICAFDLGLALYHILFGSEKDVSLEEATIFAEQYKKTRTMSQIEKENILWAISMMSAVFFLTDCHIAARTIKNGRRDEVNLSHLKYYYNYCVNTYNKYYKNKENIEIWTSQIFGKQNEDM